MPFISISKKSQKQKQQNPPKKVYFPLSRPNPSIQNFLDPELSLSSCVHWGEVEMENAHEWRNAAPVKDIKRMLSFSSVSSWKCEFICNASIENVEMFSFNKTKNKWMSEWKKEAENLHGNFLHVGAFELYFAARVKIIKFQKGLMWQFLKRVI